jgi:type I restriction enzyme M protein
MVKNNRLAPILNQYKELPLGPDQLSNLEMGYIYEDCCGASRNRAARRPGSTSPRAKSSGLMVELLDIPIPDKHISIYDPACGTGGMLSVAKEHLLDRADTPEKRRGGEAT